MEDSYIKVKEIEQNSSGTNFAIVYLDDGVFKLRVLGDTAHDTSNDSMLRSSQAIPIRKTMSRSDKAIQDSELNINKELISDEDASEMNNFTMPINNFPDPYITCCFCTDEILFVNLFHNATVTHHQFFYNWKSKEIFRKTKFKMNSNEKNFPYKCFYSEENKEVYSFYRQGESFRIYFDP